MLGGYFLLNSDSGFVSICGAVTSVCGMGVYTSLSLKESQKSSENQLPKQIVATQKPKTNTKDGIESNETSVATV